MTDENSDPVSFEIEAVREVDTAHPVTLATRTYLSTEHLWAAAHFAALAAEYEITYAATAPSFHIHLRAYVLSVLTESVAFLEALINELFHDAHEQYDSYLDPLSADVRDRLGRYWTEANQGKSDAILFKYAMARILAGLPDQAKGTNPYQDVALLIQLRNWAVHYRPQTVAGESATTAVPPRLGVKLRQKFQGCSLMDGVDNPWFPDKVLGAGCAAWAVGAARAFADDFTSAIGFEPNYQRVNHPPDLPPVPPETAH